jgi:hypothetical protein
VLFWNALDLTRKLEVFRDYYNASRVHRSRDGNTPAQRSGASLPAPAARGLSEVNAPCITPNVAPFFCQTPDDYLFWDGIHPTKAVHAIIANEVAKLLAH